MADVKLNALIDGLSGKIGNNVVMRQREGRTFLTSRAKGSTNDYQGLAENKVVVFTTSDYKFISVNIAI